MQPTYRAGLRKFYDFCKRYNVLSPFPVTEQLLCYFAAFMANQGLSPQTGHSYLSAVRSMQLSLGLPDPREQSAMPILKRIQAGIRQSTAGLPVSGETSDHSCSPRTDQPASQNVCTPTLAGVVGNFCHSVFRVLPTGGATARQYIL